VEAITKTAFVGAAVVLKFFVIVDIMINLMGKLDVASGPILSGFVE
jgi:hypothetical protein